MVALLADKVNFTPELNTSGKKRYYVLKETIHPEDTILSTYVPNIRGPNFIFKKC